MPDNQDYAELGRFLSRAASWTADDAATARSLLEAQRDAVASVHPKDDRRRTEMQSVANDLRDALATWDAHRR